MTLYALPHKFTIHPDPHMAGAYVLMCNGKFSFWAETLEEIFIVYGNHLKYGRG